MGGPAEPGGRAGMALGWGWRDGPGPIRVIEQAGLGAGGLGAGQSGPLRLSYRRLEGEAEAACPDPWRVLPAAPGRPAQSVR